MITVDDRVIITNPKYIKKSVRESLVGKIGTVTDDFGDMGVMVSFDEPLDHPDGKAHRLPFSEDELTEFTKLEEEVERVLNE